MFWYTGDMTISMEIRFTYASGLAACPCVSRTLVVSLMFSHILTRTTPLECSYFQKFLDESGLKKSKQKNLTKGLPSDI